MILTAEYSRQTQVDLGQGLQAFTAFLVHLPGDAGIETAEGSTQIAIPAEQTAVEVPGLVVILAGFIEIAGGGGGIALGDQGIDSGEVEGGVRRHAGLGRRSFRGAGLGQSHRSADQTQAGNRYRSQLHQDAGDAVPEAIGAAHKL